MVTVEWVNFREVDGVSYGYLNGRTRRSLDVFVAAVLLILLAPLMVLIALGVRLSSPGPIFFRQMRHGRNLRSFELLKFRTMHCAEEEDKNVRQATRGDPRITGIGRMLRRLSLDELPQLFNVLMGDMSMIGPRPHAIEHDNYYMELVSNYRRRFRARPGLTGLAQVSGARGGTPRIEDMQRRVDLDIEYLQKASLWLDTKIFLQTFREVFSSKTAY